MCRSAHHGNPLSFESCHSNELSTFAANATMRPSDHVVAMVKRVSEIGLIGTGGGKGFLLGKAMVRNPPNCGRLRTALTCTLACARDYVLRIRLGRVPATPPPSRPRRKNHDEGQDGGRAVNQCCTGRSSICQ
jgi:hypothetical protein